MNGWGKYRFLRIFFLVQAFLVVISANGQIDSAQLQRLEAMTPDELQQYYINEPEPIQFYKGPTVGDSTFRVLDPLSYPTATVEGEALSRHGNGAATEEAVELEDTTSLAARKKPKISLGIGMLGFHGDIGQRKMQLPVIARPAYNLTISHRLTRYLQLDFTALFGKLSAAENLDGRHENFQSEIRAGGVNVQYDFGNFIPDDYRFRPFVSLGALGFEFLSKTDLKDIAGNAYHYWSDGSIHTLDENAPGAQFSPELKRDYRYESDIRELNRDGYGKYAERAWAFPIGGGFIARIHDRVDMKIGFQYFITTTDYIDGIASKGTGARKGNKRNDNFTYTSFGLQYDLMGRRRAAGATYGDTLTDAAWLALNAEDRDHDGVTDMNDDCQGTDPSAKVDERGCPVDSDGDGIPDYRDDEPATPTGNPVNARGVSQDDAYWQAWYANYRNDTMPDNIATEVVGNIFAADYAISKKKKGRKKKVATDEYTVELVRYSGSIPSDELAFLLSIGDITSNTLPDGTTVVYTSGSYDKLSTAIKRRDEFRSEGNKGAGISRIKGRDIIPVTDEELQILLNNEMQDLLENGTDSSVVEQSFGKEDIVYRVQLGAFRNRISTSVFNTSAGVLELKTGENIFRYVTKGYRTIEEAAAVRADLVVQGYSDAFVTAYKEGKRIPLNQTKATVEKDFQEDLNEEKIFSSVNKKLLSFKVQLGPIRKKNQEAAMDEKVRNLKDVQKQLTTTGSIRYLSGTFSTLPEAESYRKSLEKQGFYDAFTIALFKDEIISIQEALELMK